MKMKKILAAVSFVAISSTATAQYPTIPDSVVARSDRESAEWAAKDNAAWQKALPEVIDGMLKGKPLNAYSATQKKFIENKELSGLYQIIKNGVTLEDKPDGEFYELTINGEKLIVNENDEIKIDNKWVLVKDLVK